MILVVLVGAAYCSAIVALEVVSMAVQIPLWVWRWHLRRQGRDLPPAASEALLWADQIEAGAEALRSIFDPLDRPLILGIHRLWMWLRGPLWVELFCLCVLIAHRLCVAPFEIAGAGLRRWWSERKSREENPAPPPENEEDNKRIHHTDRVVFVGGRLLLDRRPHKRGREGGPDDPGGG